MAYVDLKRGANVYRLHLGRIVFAGQYVEFGSGNVTYRTYPNMEIRTIGSSLQQLLNLNNLDYSNPPDSYMGSACYLFTGVNRDFKIAIIPRKKISINQTGQIISGSLLETHYVYNGYEVRIKVYTGDNEIGTLDFVAPNNVGLCGGMPNGANNSVSVFTNEVMGDIGLFYMKNVDVNGTLYTGYVVYPFETVKATSMIFGQFVAHEEKGTGSQAYLRGCVFVRAGQVYNQFFQTGNIYRKTGNFWEKIDNNETVTGKNAEVTSSAIFYNAIPGQALSIYKSDNPVLDDDTDTQYPNDDDDDDNNYGGGEGDKDKTSDDETVDDTVIPYMPTGLMTVYRLAESQLNNLGEQLWSENFLNGILKITSNPIDAVIALKCMYVTFNAANNGNVRLGNYKTNILADIISQFVQTIDFGSLAINLFYGNFFDYNPYTKISIYLPYIGVKDLSVQDIMNSTISLTYRVDVLSGDCIAMIQVQKTIDETELNSVLYTFEGNMNIEIPISQASANTMISARLSQIQQITNAAIRYGKIGSPDGSGNAWDKANVLTNAGFNIMQEEIRANHLDIARTGSIGSTKGMLAIKTPYLIIERTIAQYPSSYAQQMAIPTNETIPFNQLQGFTIITQVFISNFTGTQNEYDELLNILQMGVVF